MEMCYDHLEAYRIALAISETNGRAWTTNAVTAMSTYAFLNLQTRPNFSHCTHRG